MEKEKIKKAVTDLRAVRMTALEKHAILERIVGETPEQIVHVRSWTTLVWRNFLVRQSWSSTFIVAALIVMLAGGSVAFAAETTLPGDRLYPVKISIIEPLRSALAFGAPAQAYLEELKIERRLKEAAKLAAQGRLTDRVNQEIQEQIRISAMKMAELVAP
jgi:hypothetical protein